MTHNQMRFDLLDSIQTDADHDQQRSSSKEGCKTI